MSNSEGMEVVKYNIADNAELEDIINLYVDTNLHYYRVFVCEDESKAYV